MSKEFGNYYEVLGLLQSADNDQIKSAIKKHRIVASTRSARGGVLGDMNRRLVEYLGEAEEILLNPKKRADYDKELAQQNAPQKPQNAIPEGETDWLEKAEQYFDEGDFELARPAARKAVQRQPSNSQAWLILGIISHFLEDYREANEAVYEAILLDEENPWPYGLRGDIFLKQDQIAKAAEQYKKMEARAAGWNSSAVRTAKEHLANCEWHKTLRHILEKRKDLPAYAPEHAAHFEATFNDINSTLQSLEESYLALNSPGDWIACRHDSYLLTIGEMVTALKASVMASGEKVFPSKKYATLVASFTKSLKSKDDAIKWTRYTPLAAPMGGILLTILGILFIAVGLAGSGIWIFCAGLSILGLWAILTKERPFAQRFADLESRIHKMKRVKI